MAGLLLLVMAALTPSLAEAKPEPGAKRGFRLFARPLGAITINRVLCGLTTTGEICVDSTNSSTIGGGFWPKGTADQYVFNTGLQLAGIVGTDGGPWAGDTTGAFFFDPKGSTQHGIEVQPIYNTTSTDDQANWPDAALVPCSEGPRLAEPECQSQMGVADSVGSFYNPLLQGRINASQGDIWFMSWDGDPSLNAGRPHPLGVAVETRGLGWNFPKGNEDIIYFVYTFYNVSCTDANLGATCFPGVRPPMARILNEQGRTFQALNNAAFNVSLPTSGYTIDPLYAAFGTDMDVGDAGTNYASVNLPFALGDTYDRTFDRFAGWTFDPSIFSAPFFAGTGFVGVKYLASPPATGATTYAGPGEIQLYSNTENGGNFGDPQNTTQLYRYLSGNISTAAGDAPCNTGNPVVTKICYVNNSRPFDMRFFQSSTPLTLPPGGFGSIVVAYVFAAPVDGICAPPCDIVPGNVEAISNPGLAGNPANIPDQQKLAGYVNWSDVNGNNVVEQDEFIVVPGSLLGKALTAQAVFNAKFLLPFSPESPDFFLIPGDQSVTVMWQPSPSELPGGGDPYYQVAKDAQVAGAVNPLYDPNYREFDVEGYRIYRGRVDSPGELTLLAQFDYAGTVMQDYGAQVDYAPLCAPELGLDSNNPQASCPATLMAPTGAAGTGYEQADFVPGFQRDQYVNVDLVQQTASGPANVLNQVKLGERALLGDGTAIVLISDTAGVGVSGSCAGTNTLSCPPLTDNGVPFVFVDDTPLNNFRYFYSVTAFDVNSWQSGPTNLESPRITKAAVPTKAATNYELEAQIVSKQLVGRGVVLDGTLPVPNIDPITGIFSGPMPPADGWDVKFSDFVAEMLEGAGAFSARLDSVHQGNPVDDGTPNVFFFSGLSGSAPPVTFTLSAGQGLDDSGQTFESLTFPAVNIDGDLAARFGGDASYTLQGQASYTTPGVYQTNGTWRGAAFGASGTGVEYAGQWFDGPRWFDGDPRAGANETFAHPTQGNCPNNCNWVNATNAGSLAGVTNVHHPMHYMSQNFHWRGVAWNNAGASRAADISVFWGPGGSVDSVIDITHNVVVPFGPAMQGNWGFLTFAAQSGESGTFDQDPSILTMGDVVCTEPLIRHMVNFSAAPGCQGATTPAIQLVNTASIGPMGMGVNGSSYESAANYSTVTTTGFMIYIAGNWFLFDTATLPAAGAIWTMRDYMGAVLGGEGRDASGAPVDQIGPYTFSSQVRPMTAVGVEMQVSYNVINQVNQVTADDIANVHPVPDPFYITSEFDNSATENRIEFINLPAQAIIRIYSSSGVLVDLLEHNSTQAGGSESWGVRNRNNQVVASGVYFYHVESNDQRRVGRMTIVRFAQ